MSSTASSPNSGSPVASSPSISAGSSPNTPVAAPIPSVLPKAASTAPTSNSWSSSLFKNLATTFGQATNQAASMGVNRLLSKSPAPAKPVSVAPVGTIMGVKSSTLLLGGAVLLGILFFVKPKGNRA